MTNILLTTIDNPFNPFEDWDAWYTWDESKGYHTLGLLDRICISSDELSQEDQEEDILEAMRIIVSENYSGVHVLTSKDGIIETPS